LPRIDHTFELPQGWAWATLGHLSLSVKDGPHYSPKYVDDGIPFISGGNVRSSSKRSRCIRTSPSRLSRSNCRRPCMSTTP
jgi:hypothetical protein